jgi:DNA-binding XRE family transcriptional regulator
MPNTGGTIYAIGAEGQPYIKIGSTSGSPLKRLQDLQTGQPYPLRLCAAVPVEANLRLIEKHVHAFLKEKRQRGEWFELSMDIAQLEALVVRAVEYVQREEQQAAALHTIQEARQRTRMTMEERITYLRKKKGWSQAELARQVSIGQSTLHAYEAGNRPAQGMSVEIAMRLARVLGVTVDYLVGVYEEASAEEICEKRILSCPPSPSP